MGSSPITSTVTSTRANAKELAIPLKSASAALAELVDARILVVHGAVQGSGRGRPSRLYTSAELLGLTGSSPLRA